MNKKTFLAMASCFAIHQNCMADQTPHRLYIAPDVSYRHYSDGKNHSVKFRDLPSEWFPEELKDNQELSQLTISLEDQWVYLAGGQVGYDYIQPGNIYFGTDVYYAAGTGHAKYRIDLRPIANKKYERVLSTFKENCFNIEERMGYSWRQKAWDVIWTPFIGAGYFQRIQDSLDFYRWGYGALGLRTLWQCAEGCEIGLNLEAMRPFWSRLEFDGGSLEEDISLKLRNLWQYQIELPLTAYIDDEKTADIRLVPYMLIQNTGDRRSYMNFFPGNHIQHFGDISSPAIKSYSLGARLEFGFDF